MMFLFALIAGVSAYTQLEYETAFKTFLKTHGKVYEGDEVAYRFGVFRASMDAVLEHNSGNHSWTKGINRFSDLTNVEFKRSMLGYVSRGKTTDAVSGEFTGDVDWRKTAITPVKDQGQCGSCWAFSTTGGMEGAGYIASKKVVSLSEQSLVDCSGSYGNQGCNGGLMDNAFKYIKDHGIPIESAYPYTAKDGTCKTYTSQTKLSKFTDVSNLETALQQQPVSVAVDATKWDSYHGGTFECSGDPHLDHGVTLVASFSDYWVIKNSWGSDWGEEGFIKLSKEASHNCGVTQAASYPTI